MENKLYCFVDETGQDTRGKIFLVAIVIDNINNIEIIEEKLKSIEKYSGKYLVKWKSTEKSAKVIFLSEILKIKELRHDIFYEIHTGNTEGYTKLTAFSLAKAINYKAEEPYLATITIDGLNDKEKSIVRNELKKLKIHYRKIKGIKDEQSPMLRLADAMAGFLRDALVDKQPYTRKIIEQFNEKSIVREL